jgi:beta-xylosidase
MYKINDYYYLMSAESGTNGIVDSVYTSPNLRQQIWEKDSVRDNFDRAILRLPRNIISNPHAEDWSLTVKPGFLRLI